jgi:neutral ceramidase
MPMRLTALLPLCLLALSLPARPEILRAAAVKVDITPQTSEWLVGYDARQSKGVHDKIFHRILAIDDGKTKFYLIASDLCLFSPSVYDEVAAQLQEQLAIPRQSVWWSVTHTHSAPEIGPPTIYRALLGRSNHEWSRDYTNKVTSALIQGVKEATKKLEPATIEIGSGTSVANINRRAKDVDGTVTLGLNPEGPVDRQIGLLSFVRPDHSVIAVVANYAMHGTVLSGQNLEISGDAPGIVASYVEEKIGAPMLCVNGAAGNIAPIYSVYPNAESGHLSQFRVLLGDRILAGLKELSPKPSKGDLALDEITVETPIKPGLSWPDELSRYTGKSASGAAVVQLPVRFLRISDTVVWSAPVELFCEMAMQIRSHSPFTNTFYFGYTNGWFGYLPTSKAFSEGGYEPKTSPFTEAAERDLLHAVETKIRELKR